MTPRRGDVVIVDYPYSDRTGSKVRPALVVRSDRLNASRSDTILAIISSASSGRSATEARVEVAVEPASGLRFDSHVQADTLVTIDRSLILARIGGLSASAIRAIDDRLKTALALP